MRISVLTLFPELFQSFSKWSIIGRAKSNNKIDLNFINIRDYSKNKHKKVDDYTYGGGPGMLMTPEPIYDSIMDVKKEDSLVIYLSPQGKIYNQDMANTLSKKNDIILLCGHYEGIDNRILENYVDMEISIGDFVLTGGEIPAMLIIDSIVRLLPDVLASKESYEYESHYNGLLEYPQYTRPRVFNDLHVPDVLLSGNHKEIEKWRKEKSIEITKNKRPDLLNLNKSDE